MKVYIDESNITPRPKLIYVSAAAIAENSEVFAKVKYFLFERNLVELKGTDLCTKNMTKDRQGIVEEVVSKLTGTFVVWDYFLQKSLDLTFEGSNMLDTKKIGHSEVRIAWLERVILASSMAENCRNILEIFNEKDWAKNFDESAFIVQVEKLIKNTERHIAGFKNSASRFIEKVIKSEPLGGSKNIANEKYQVITSLLVTTLEKFSQNKLEVDIDEIGDSKERELIRVFFDEGMPQNTFNYVESINSIGVQVADGVAAISRKTIGDLLDHFFCHNFYGTSGEIAVKSLDFGYGNELLKTGKILSATFGDFSRVQIPFRQRAFLDILREADSIEEICKNSFWAKVDSHESKVALREVLNQNEAINN